MPYETGKQNHSGLFIESTAVINQRGGPDLTAATEHERSLLRNGRPVAWKTFIKQKVFI